MDDKYLDGDPKLIWQDQIAGVVAYDHGDFIGALADLQGDPNWKTAFAEIASEPGVPAFGGAGSGSSGRTIRAR